MADVTTLRTAAETGLSKLFEVQRLKLPGAAIAREEAFRYFEAAGLPHRRVEAFKYTDLRAAVREAAPPAEAPDAETARNAVKTARGFAGIEAARLTFVNGHLVAALSDLSGLPEGLEVVTFANAMAEGHPLLDHLAPVEQTRENPIYQLNAAFMADGAVIRVEAGAKIERALHLRFIGTGEARSRPRPACWSWPATMPR